jgi:polysaccharide deacetylase family protein (PEP-CTERM system associated)
VTDRKHAFTLSIDWEDFGQLLGRDRFGVVTPPVGNAIERQTDILLQLLAETQRKATFFILGMLAKFRPGLVKQIAAAGHEIGLHGSQHLDMRKLTRAQAEADLRESQKLVTDIIGAPVYGYRAPYFSVDTSNLYVLEILAEIGLTYDSSIFPMKLRRYGIANFNTDDAFYRLPNQREIVELPLTVAPAFGRRIPVAGGGYVRLFPRMMLNRIFRRLDLNGRNVMLYMHPYEFDSSPIDCATNCPPGARYPAMQRFVLNRKWNLFRGTIHGKIKALLERYDFITCHQKAEYVKAAHSPGILECAK